MVEMQFHSLSFDPIDQRPVILLQEYVDDGKTLLIPVGAMEELAISLILSKERLPRPLIYDLLLLCLRSLNCKMTHAEITSFRDGSFNAAIVLRSRQRGFRIVSRPSDAITLAIRTNVPIYVNDEVFNSIEIATSADCDQEQHHMNPDAATDMVRKISAQHVVEMMSASRHHIDKPPVIDELCDADLQELLRCLEPVTRCKM